MFQGPPSERNLAFRCYITDKVLHSINALMMDGIIMKIIYSPFCWGPPESPWWTPGGPWTPLWEPQNNKLKLSLNVVADSETVLHRTSRWRWTSQTSDSWGVLSAANRIPACSTWRRTRKWLLSAGSDRRRGGGLTLTVYSASVYLKTQK